MKPQNILLSRQFICKLIINFDFVPGKECKTWNSSYISENTIYECNIRANIWDRELCTVFKKIIIKIPLILFGIVHLYEPKCYQNCFANPLLSQKYFCRFENITAIVTIRVGSDVLSDVLRGMRKSIRHFSVF